MDKIDRLLMEESMPKKRVGTKKRIQSGKNYQQAPKSRIINSPTKKYASYSRGLNKFGMKGRSPQRFSKPTAVKASYKADMDRRSNSMKQ
jgi:hypothetical protein